MKKLILLLVGLIINTNVEASVMSFQGVLTTINPCSEELVTIHGITTISINKTLQGVFVHEHFAGTENGYSANYYGKNKFDKISKFYEIELTGNWEGNLNNFSSIAKDKINAVNGIVPIDDKFQSINNECEEN